MAASRPSNRLGQPAFLADIAVSGHWRGVASVVSLDTIVALPFGQGGD